MLGRILILLICGFVTVPSVMAQDTSLSTTMNVHVFPSEGQDEIQQSMDEAECFSWSAERTGTDPFELSNKAAQQAAAAEQAMAQAQSAGQGSTGRAAAGGAVAGGFVGAVFGRGKNSGWKGAAAGAATALLSATPVNAEDRRKQASKLQSSQPRTRQSLRHK